MLTTRYVDGAPDWIDLGTPDLDGATAFYGEVLGWGFRSAGPEAGGYGMFEVDGRTAAGGMTVTGEQGPPAWTVYFQTPDADATAKAVREAGGTVLLAPMDVFDLGRTAVLADSAGAAFGAWQPGKNKGLDVVGEPGALCWTELYTPDVPRAAAFYDKVFGWETANTPWPGGAFTSARPAGTGEEAMFGGLWPLEADPSESGRRPRWLVYFEVGDCDAVVARAGRLGGGTRTEPMSMEGVGRVATLRDPYGAEFGVVTSEPGT
ncbi:VOC family protein [Streptomyces sp. GC420]|uniref:VOC family protein n=1 Tax=Streptomyces sp. GC420 TaxID=2697568 RepID=UPI001414D9E7|nr:VOC family protein [Streptomyces sp. GC420]NBM17377.1 VOC family protein [Streptomyces sp. GC420]